MPINYTPEQIKFIIEPSGNIYLKACPGAGKTNAIVRRFIKIATELSNDYGRRCIAALSFTNVAVDEISTRCKKENVPYLIEYPNYVGTFDGFIIRYIFRQLICKPIKRPLTILESWDSIDAQVYDGKGGVIPLSRFDFSGEKVKCNHKSDYLSRKAFEKNPDKWIKLAIEKRKYYFNNYIVSTSDVRNIICNPSVKNIHNIYSNMSLRFSEIIVDEIQDCNWQDLLILKNLRDYGVNVVMVGDLDQSIYAFRDVNIDEINKFVSTHKTFNLTNNFRSSQNICNLSSSLKQDLTIDTAQAEYKDENLPVYILPYKGKPTKIIGDRYFKIVNEKGLLNKKSKVISYQEKTSHQALGIKKNEPGTTALEALGNAINIFRDSSSSSKAKLHSLKIIEKYLLKLLGQEIIHLSSEAYCEQLNIEYRWLRRCALYVLESFPTAPNKKCDSDSWIVEIKKKFGQLPMPSNNSLQWIASGKIFKKQKSWIIKDTGVDISCSSTIHGVKGEEFESVLVIMDENKSDTIFANWNNTNITESERVIYVAITRAKRLLCIAIPDKHLTTMKSILDKHKVIYEIIT
jgi:superfamily I DNA/RNA helicase